MKNKKSQGVLESLITYGWAILVILVIIGVLAYLDFYERPIFNPETDVCEEWDACKESYLGLVCTEDFQRCYCKEIGDTKCKEWLPKTKCELNPNDEDCVCEEFEIETYLNVTYINDDDVRGYSNILYLYDDVCEELSENKTECNFNLYYHENGIWYLSTLPSKVDIIDKISDCIKAREKTECEKGNKDWAEKKEYQEGKIVLIGEGFIAEAYYCYPPINHSDCYETICSPKTFQDLTCWELEEAWQNAPNMRFTQFYYDGKFYSRNEIEHQQLLKVCFK